MTSGERDAETRRLALFDRYAFMTETESETLSEICALACGLFEVEFAQITLLGAERGYFLTRNRMAQRSFDRKNGFTDRVFRAPDVVVIPDALMDERYSDLPRDSLHKARFYGGAPLMIEPGISLGLMAIFDSTPHTDFTDAERAHFRRLAVLAVNELKRQRGLLDLKKRETALVAARDAADAASQAKSSFLATMSHEIRTPLNGVLGMAQVMAGDDLSNTQRERLEILRQSGETLLGLLNDILDLSKIEAGKLVLDDAEFDLGQLVTHAHNGFAGIAAGKELAFELTIDKSAEGVYRGDALRVRQILANLISNALKFTARGGVSVAIGRDGDTLTFGVQDTGIGISSDAITRLFEKFMQADSSTTRRYGGTGLGLSICQQLCEAMGGDITVTSEEGKGTLFRVRLPLPRTRATLMPVAAAAPVAAVSGALRVLAAEDNLINQKVLEAFLIQLGVSPVIVPNGCKAVEAWEGGDWDLILMDIQMPEMDGRQATAAIRKREGETGRARTPIFALTADVMSHQVADYHGTDIDGVLAKPIERIRLSECVNRFRV